MTEEEVVAELRSDLTDLTAVGYGGPDVGLLLAAGEVRWLVYGRVLLDSIPLGTALPHRPPGRRHGLRGVRRPAQGDASQS